MEGKRTISKPKGVEMCVDWIYSGRPRKEIVQELTKTYGISESAVDKWMKAARPVVAERQREAEAIRSAEDKAAIAESAKRLNLTKERILEEYAKIAFFDIRKIMTVDGGLRPVGAIDDVNVGAIAGIESYDEKSQEGETLGTLRKIKIWDKRAALDSICKVLGYNAPEKAQVDHTTNGQTIHTTFIIKRRSDKDRAGN